MNRRVNTSRRIVLLGLLGAVLILAQVSLAVLPNIEIVSLLLIVFTLCIGSYVLAPLLVFILVEGLLYGFSMWWFNYLYVWPLLCLLAHVFRRQRAPVFWAIISGVFGLCFGALCSIPYFFIGGASTAFAYFISGLHFDLLHCAGNFITALVLFKPVYGACRQLLGGGWLTV